MNNIIPIERHYETNNDTTQQPLSDQFRNLCTLFAFDAASEGVEKLGYDFTATVAACLHTTHTSRLQLLVCHDWQISRLAGVHYYLTSFGFGLVLKQLSSGDYVVGIRFLPDLGQSAKVEA